MFRKKQGQGVLRGERASFPSPVLTPDHPFMKAWQHLTTWTAMTAFAVVTPQLRSQTTYTDNFTTNVNYLTNGVAGTIWDGVYFGAGDFNNTALGGDGPGATIQCDANLSNPGELTLQTTATDWENTADDGFFLFKVVKGDFSAVVHVVTPFNNAAYNTAGLQARAFAAGGDPFGGSENFVSWTRFDEYNFPNYLRNEVNSGVQQINPGGYPNNAYWLRMDRVGNSFRFFQRTNSTDAWKIVSFPSPVSGTNLVRADLAGQPLEVGIIHATFNGQLGVQFSDFSVTATNFNSFAAPPSPVTVFSVGTNGSGGLNVAWSPAAGSSGTLVAVWPATNSVIREMPANGFAYAGNASYGAGDALPGAGYFVVYSGPGTSTTINNLAPNATYNIAIYSYAGSGGSISYNHKPPVASVTIPPNPLVMQERIENPDVVIQFSANPGKWYWLQDSDSLGPANWQNVGSAPVFANSSGMVVVHTGGALAAQRFYRLEQVDPQFAVKTSGNGNGNGGITSLQRTGDAYPTEYISGGTLGNVIMKYQPSGGATWNTVRTATPSGVASATNYTSADGTQYISHYVINSGLSGSLVLESVFTFQQDGLLWSVNLTNLASQSVTMGDLALPLPMNTAYSGVTSSTMKHSFISGYDSFLFWMRPDSVGPYLLMTPDANTKLEFWDDLNGYEVYIHSYVAGTNAAAQYPSVTTQGQRWRQPNTSLILAPGASQKYSFKFQWADNYDAIRQALVENGKVDVHIVPGMTVPTNLFAEIALDTTQTINSVNAEFPTQTQIQPLGSTNADGNAYQLYRVQFSKLGENELTIAYGGDQTNFLEFFVTEPLETLIKKRAAFLVDTQIITNKWYSGLFCDVNMNDGALLTPDNHDTLGNSFQVYEIASDDAGESRPAYLATKEAVFPLQSEVSALDYYITNFVWGGLQLTTNEADSYGIFGVPDWYTLRSEANTNIYRGYDYPHIIVMYYEMYRVAKNYPEIHTALPADTYLQRAWGTAMALWSYGGGQATQVGLMNEMVIPNLIADLDAEGMTSQAAQLRTNWETKVNYYVGGNADLFASEYSFDSTGFESQEAYAKYALQHAGSDALMGSANPAAFLQQVTNYALTQITANIFDRGWLETAYYFYGSDYRQQMGDNYIVTYMAQEGGWGLLDYAYHFATNATDYLRLGYASYLNGWSTMNSGPPPTYGFWYPGAAYDGGCGGGFEPSPYNTTWLGGQPMHRGPWYYSAEENLGFCGAVRMAATILADDPIFGRFCYGGDWTNAADGIEVVPLDGVRQRFHAMLNNGNLHLVLDNDHFAAGQPIVLQPDLSQVNFQIESDDTAAHSVTLHFTPSTAATYTVSGTAGVITTTNLVAGQEALVSLPMAVGTSPQSFAISR
jgi:Family of unknown function (DUF5695)